MITAHFSHYETYAHEKIVLHSALTTGKSILAYYNDDGLNDFSELLGKIILL